MNILYTKDLKVKYKDRTILENINLYIEEGKIYSIIGPNGCGKTTLLKALTRGVKISNGSIFLEDKNLRKIKSKNVAKTIGVLNQSNNGISDITIKELVSYGRYAHKSWWMGNSNEDKDIIDWAINKTNLKNMENRRINTLSGGEKQRAWIAMSIAQRPKILILDEPTTYLDISHQLEILDLIKTLNEEENMTIVMVLHDINHAARYSDELIVIYDKRLYARGNPWEILGGNVFKDVFRVKADILKDMDEGKPLFHPKKVI